MGQLTNPPVVEVVVGVQFVTLPQMTSGHYGLFWARHLGTDEWPETDDAPALPEQFELFEGRSVWGHPQVALQLVPMSAPRVQFRSADGERVVQIQPNRFLYNWRKRTRGYPSFKLVRAAFESCFERFTEFVAAQALGPLLLNQWEITYVDRVPPGALWKEPAEWPRVVSGLLVPAGVGLPASADGFNGEWHFALPDHRGRVHLAVRSGPPESATAEPPLIIQTTVRGAIGEPGTPDWRTGFDLGHSAAVETFFAVTSSEAHREWGVQ